MKYVVVETKKDIDAICEYLKTQSVLGLDTETTELDPRDGLLRLIQVSDGKKTFLIDVFHLFRNEGFEMVERKDTFGLFDSLRDIFENPEIKIVIHNFKFEEKWLSVSCGIHCNSVFDTFLAAQLVDYNEIKDPERGHKLGLVARRYIGVDLDKTEQLSDWSQWDLSREQLDYAALDVYYLPKLREALVQELVNTGQLEPARLDFECVPAVIDAEVYGLKVNRKLYSKEIVNLTALREVASKSLQNVLRETNPNRGIQGTLFEEIPEKNYSDVLLTSHDQVRKALVNLGIPVFTKKELDKIKQAERSGIMFAIGTGEKELSKMQGKYPVIKLLFDFRGVEKMITAFGENFLSHLRKDVNGDERVHTDFYIIGAPTGRMASKKPNVQQIPAKTVEVGEEEHALEFRNAFDFPEGKIGVNCDFSQIELRIAAEFSQDPIFLDAFRTDKDLHALTASLIFNVPYEDCANSKHEYYKKYRQFAKRINFGIIYGIGPFGLAAQLRITPEEAKDIIDKHRLAHPVLWEYLDNQANRAIRTLTARTASGRLQKFTPPSIDPATGKPSRGEIGTIGRNGKNMPIQGCLGGKNRVLVEGLGYRKIEEVPRGEVTIWDGETFVSANVAESGEKLLTKIYLMGNTFIECSPEHKFLAKYRGETEYGWVKASDLKNQATIKIGNNVPEYDYLTATPEFLNLTSEEAGLVVGIFYNLAVKANRKIVRVLECEYDVKDLIVRLFDKVGLHYTLEKEFKNKLYLYDVFTIENFELIEPLLNRFDIRKGFTEETWASKPFMRGFLKVLLDYSVMTHNLITVRVGDAQLAKDVQEAFMLFKVSTRIDKTLWKKIPRIYIRGENIIRMAKNIGLVREGRILRATTLLKLNRSFWKVNLRDATVKVKEVEQTLKKIPMYDIVDSQTSQFMASGLVTHNTAADILKRSLKLLYDALKGYDAHIVNIVHDEITVEVVKEQAEAVRKILEKAMKDAGEEYLQIVPTVVEAKLMTNWGDK